MVELGKAYGISSFDLYSMSDMTQVVAELEKPGPSIIQVHLDVSQGFEPRLRSRQQADGTIVTPNLEDMYPFLSEEELAKNMIGIPEEVKK
jgi:acetolactate synthase-1/2/3 large subunit